MIEKHVVVTIECVGCGWNTKETIKPNEYGVFQLQTSYCPECFCLLSMDIKEKDNPMWGEWFGDKAKTATEKAEAHLEEQRARRMD